MDAAFDDYRTDSTYIKHYAGEIAPERIRISLLLHGVAMPEPEAGQPFRYLELGFGMGISLNIHAAVKEGEFWGNDFMREHVEFAQSAADAAGLKSKILNKSFAEMDEMSAAGELPQFDVIAFHGIWSWINAENRAHIHNILRRNLKSGGVVYISYNAMPGWTFFMPVRELMAYNVERLGDDIDILQRTKTTLDYVKAMMAANAAFFEAAPQAKSFLDMLDKMPLNYIAQEFCNRSWRTFYFREVAEEMQSIGCSFVTSSNLIQQTGAVVPPGTRPLLAQTINPIARETLRDFAMNQRFRSDLFVRDAKWLNSRDHMAKLGECCLALEPGNKKLSLQTSYGEIILDEELYGSIAKAIADAMPHPAKISDIAAKTGISRQLLVECISVMLAKNIVSPAVENPSESCIEASIRLNRDLCRTSLEEPRAILASPVTGSGIVITNAEIAFLHCMPEDETNYRAWAKQVIDFHTNHERLDYLKSLESATEKVEAFAKERLPYLRARKAVR